MIYLGLSDDEDYDDLEGSGVNYTFDDNNESFSSITSPVLSIVFKCMLIIYFFLFKIINFECFACI